MNSYYEYLQRRYPLECLELGERVVQAMDWVGDSTSRSETMVEQKEEEEH